MYIHYTENTGDTFGYRNKMPEVIWSFMTKSSSRLKCRQ